MRKIFAGASALAAFFITAAAYADQPRPWQMRFQDAATSIMEEITWFEEYTLWFIVPITLLVLALLAVCILRFRASLNRVPSRTSHNTLIEVLWTVGPVVVLLFLAVPSFQLLTAQYTPPEEPKLTIKATGNQWNWDYRISGRRASFVQFRAFGGRCPRRCRQGRSCRISATTGGR